MTFEGKKYTHLSFETVPHLNFDAYQKVREAWDNFDSKPRRNLKTVRDFEGFVSYIETQKLPDQVVKRYLSKVDGDVKRLKRDLCRAFRGHQAGFDKIRLTTKMKYQEFVDTLIDCGIECTVSDLDNAGRNTFEPHRTIATPRVVETLNKLKSQHFPDIEISAFLASTDKVEYGTRNP